MIDLPKLYVPPHRRGATALADVTNTLPTSRRATSKRPDRIRLSNQPATSSETRSGTGPRSRPLTFPDKPRPGPGAQRTAPPSYTVIAAHYVGLGERVLHTDFDPRQLESREGDAIGEVECVGSYKWVQSGDGRPTIAVPAVPDNWNPPDSIGTLELDKYLPDYQEFPDYAAALLPENLSTLEPTFLCLATPSALEDVDLVTGRNSLRKFWAALDPGYSDHSRPFRIDLVTVGGLLLLDRFEPVDSHRSRVPSGYHLAYHEAVTRPVLDGSDRTPGCIRVIKYSFGGLRMMVKFDVGAFLPSCSGIGDEHKESRTEQNEYDTVSRSTAGPIDRGTYVPDQDLNGVGDPMDGLDFDDPVYNGQSIAVCHTRLVPPPQARLVSIKTKSHHHPCDRAHYFPQMYFAQIARLHYARHAQGDFSKHPVEVYDLLDVRQQALVQDTIDRMAAMLRWLVELVKEHGGEGRPLGLVWDGRRFSVAVRLHGTHLSEPVIEMIKDARGQ